MKVIYIDGTPEEITRVMRDLNIAGDIASQRGAVANAESDSQIDKTGSGESEKPAAKPKRKRKSAAKTKPPAETEESAASNDTPAVEKAAAQETENPDPAAEANVDNAITVGYVSAYAKTAVQLHPSLMGRLRPMLATFGVKSISQLSDDEAKRFYDEFRQLESEVKTAKTGKIADTAAGEGA